MKEKGFSLLELIVVLIVISLSIALITPSVGRISKTLELKAAAKRISGILRYYRSESVQKGIVYQVCFDSNGRELRIQVAETKEEEEQKGRQAPARFPLPQGIQIKELNIPDPLYPADAPAVEFYANGGSNGGTITLDNQGVKGLRIRIHFLTGVVVIEEV